MFTDKQTLPLTIILLVVALGSGMAGNMHGRQQGWLAEKTAHAKTQMLLADERFAHKVTEQALVAIVRALQTLQHEIGQRCIELQLTPEHATSDAACRALLVVEQRPRLLGGWFVMIATPTKEDPHAHRSFEVILGADGEIVGLMPYSRQNHNNQ